MPIELPVSSEDLVGLDRLTPRQIVAELDRYVVGQGAAKKAVAIALRNRIRRQRLAPEVAAEVTPKNILMIGPTGVGKTEIARRLARLSNSPFLKVEASKFTEVGYVGRDVESMVRDLTESAVDMVRREKHAEVRRQAESNVEEQILDLLLPVSRPAPVVEAAVEEGSLPPEAPAGKTREKLRDQLRAGQLDSRSVEIEVREKSFPGFQILSSQGVEEMDINVKDLLPGLFGNKTKRRRVGIPEARTLLLQEEQNRLV
ncbi:MAG TPA: AAA family ATPase, partial [Vicinamibacteria bacterium]|nr:AAA family ATPase [Vicinamibacteria bacterium]